MTRRSILFTSMTDSSNSPIPPEAPMPLPTGADSLPPRPGGSERETGVEPSGETTPVVPDPIVSPPAFSAEVEDEDAAIRQEVERFRGSRSAEDFIAAVTALLKIPDLASANLDAIMGGEDPAFQLCLLETARGVDAARRASKASVRSSVAAIYLQRLRGTTVPTMEPPRLIPPTSELALAKPVPARQQGTDVEYQAKLWTDEDGFQIEVATLSQADATSKDSVLARRLCDEAAARAPLGIQGVKLDPVSVHSALLAKAAGLREKDFDRSSSTLVTTTSQEDGFLTLASLPWMKEGPKGKKFLTLLGQNSWHDVQSPDSLQVIDCGIRSEGPADCIRKLGYILVGVYGSHCEGMMGLLLAAIATSQVNTRRSSGYIFARADGVLRQLWDHLRNARRSSSADTPLRRGGWKAMWEESVRAIMWTDQAEEKWRKAFPDLPLEPQHERRDTIQRAPKRKHEEETPRTSHTTPSSTLTSTPDASRRLAASQSRPKKDGPSDRRPCLPAVATELGVKRKDGSNFRCGDRCSFDHDWKTIEPRLLARYLSESAVQKVRQFKDEKAAVTRLVELARPYLK